jgi:hypothetical protein
LKANAPSSRQVKNNSFQTTNNGYCEEKGGFIAYAISDE